MAGRHNVTRNSANSILKKPHFKNSANSKTILVVEDEVINQLLLLEILRSFGYRAELATNGVQALELYGKAEYKIIFMDIGLPDISGLDISEAIRKVDPTRKTPIVAVTAYGEEIRDNCLNAGMDDFLTKPITISKIGFMLDKYLLNPKKLEKTGY